MAMQRFLTTWGVMAFGLVLCLASLNAEDKPSSEGFVQLFNGKDLTGWKAHPSSSGKWEVVDGAIVGTGPASHLFSERGDYKNFHYRMEAKISDGGNSGQYFRTQFGPGFPKGYEAQINSTGRDPVKTGSLYGFKDCLVKDILVKPGEWFTQEVIAEGNHIIIKVNGKVTVDTTDKDNKFSEGHFAIQQHDPGSKVYVRKVEVKELK
jgi:hypothetical protein